MILSIVSAPYNVQPLVNYCNTGLQITTTFQLVIYHHPYSTIISFIHLLLIAQTQLKYIHLYVKVLQSKQNCVMNKPRKIIGCQIPIVQQCTNIYSAFVKKKLYYL